MFNPTHPGEFITATYLEPCHLSARSLADALGVAVTSVTRVLNGSTRVSPEMALRLEAVLGASARFWLTMQNNYDLWQARQTLDVAKLRHLDLVAA